MAPKPSHDTLIHCDACGEDYSATYRRCPFCGERNDPRRTAPRSSAPVPPPMRSSGTDDLGDGYVFDGQDAFDDEPEEDYLSARPKGGKRLAPKQQGAHFDSPPINWPRLITFLCSLIIIVAALIIVFTVIYPQLHGSKDPNTGPSQPVSPPSQSQGIDVPPSSDVVPPTDPVTQSSQPVEPPPPVGPTLTGLTLNSTDFTLWVGESFQVTATAIPADWSGQITWSSSNPEWISVSETGMVTNVNTSGAFHNVYVTATADGVSAQCVVRARANKKGADTPPPQSDPPATSQPPVVTQPPTGGSVMVGARGTIVGADGGLRVRSGPGTSYDIVASLLNGNTITVVSAAEGGWYQISFAGSGGAVINGYILGQYISTN